MECTVPFVCLLRNHRRTLVVLLLVSVVWDVLVLFIDSSKDGHSNTLYLPGRQEHSSLPRTAWIAAHLLCAALEFRFRLRSFRHVPFLFHMTLPEVKRTCLQHVRILNSDVLLHVFFT